MCLEIILNGEVITEKERAEELFEASGLVKTSRFSDFCDIIGNVGRILSRNSGRIDKIIYDYDEKSGIIRCSVSALHADGADDTLSFFRYMIDRVDVFEVVPSEEGLSMTFEIWNIFMEEGHGI